MSARGLVIAAPASGSGKTTITLGLLRHLARSGVRVASAKAGPDYIDPAFHAAASGRPCVNLDSWAMRRATVARLADELGRDAEIMLCEGVMGLFDGAGPDAAGATADLAALLGWPVVMVLDIARQGASAAAVLRGFAMHRADLRVAGVILNRAAGESHAALATGAIARHLPDLPMLGCMSRRAELALPERHLGLVQAREHPDLDRFLNAAADAVAAGIDVAALLRLARSTTLAAAGDAGPPVPPLGQRIAVARDQAYSFAYPATLAAWQRAGAALSFFSPLADEAPAAECDAVFLPGGYPELHGGRLAANARFMSALRQAAARGAVIYGECGGYMTLGQGMIDADGTRHAMAGLLPLESSFARRKLHLGYRRAELLAATPFAAAGTAWRGHEFHYANVIDEGPGNALFAVSDAAGRPYAPAGRRHGGVLGSFLHLIDCE